MGKGAHVVIDVIIIGGGQAGLATAYYLRRAGIQHAVLDAGRTAGGAWVHGWESLRLFSPREWSSLPGWMMPASAEDEYPSRDDAIAYLTAYEQRYGIAVERPVAVRCIVRGTDGLDVETDHGVRSARMVVSATGTWSKPFIPTYPGQDSYTGVQLHSAHYQTPAPFIGKRVLVVGGGNSGAQIMADLSNSARASWVTVEPPVFLPDEVDGRVLFARATERWKAQKEGRTVDAPIGGLGDIVAVAPVRAARARGDLTTRRPFRAFIPEGVVWDDGSSEVIDAVIWCTGFRPALDHLQGLGVINQQGRVDVDGNRAVLEPRLWLVGYGDWTGPASATLIGVGRSARSLVDEIARSLASTHN